PSDQRICSKSKCKRVLPHDNPKMTCQKCQDADRLSTAAWRKRNQAADTESNDESTLVSIQDGFKEKGTYMLSQYENAQCLFAALQTSFTSSSDVQFHGSYLVPKDPITTEKERVQMAALEVWRTIRYCF
ncbi:hypothetical protein DEU56DRAFT_716918, partial [Suillus clintonianus]|uniref:uncharacterized protein n=1 Tax=Suillus clintonianus TaxID=1904413 RepID=UPI001B85B68E